MYPPYTCTCQYSEGSLNQLYFSQIFEKDRRACNRPSLASRVTTSYSGQFDCKVGRKSKSNNPVDSFKIRNFEICGPARLFCQIKQGSLRSLEKPDSVIPSSSFENLCIKKHSQPSDLSLN